MLVIQFKLVAGRYHATEWGRHVNEGVPEWPPSPWRILRSLVAVWQRTLPELAVADVVPVLETLAQEQPAFQLPQATTSHTRHYMPWGKKGPDDRTLVLDPFVATEAETPIFAIWRDADLTLNQRATLATILNNLPYLGRAESWCEASLVESRPEPNAVPMDSGAVPQGELDIVRVLVPNTPVKLRDLCVETADLRKQGRVEPPGAHWHLYTRPADCFAASSMQAGSRPAQTTARPEVVRLALYARPLPLVTDTLKIGDLARRCAMSQFGGKGNMEAKSRILSGKSEDGNPLQGHGHSFYLPTDEDEDGRIDHLTVYARDGLDRDELEAVASIDGMNPRDGKAEIQVALLSYGMLEDFVESGSSLHHLFGRSRTWEWRTPFVLNRHIKVRSRDKSGMPTRVVDGPEDQLRLELKRHSKPYTADDVRIESLDKITPRGWREMRPLEFHRWRSGGPQGGSSHGFRIYFKELIAGPIALGYGCHFGLGMFTPIAE